MNFLWRVGLERNGMIIFIFPISRSIATYYGLKWSHNGIFIFSEFFSFFLEFSITRWVGTKRNDNFCFPSFSAFFNVFWLEMKPQWYFSNFWYFFSNFFMNFLLRVGLEQNGMIIFIFPVFGSIPTYYVLKLATMIFLNFLKFFPIFWNFLLRVG